jgi:wyosine [tRNA(Phe)-imidazoG37] synthetase (radical SAM superfamily)
MDADVVSGGDMSKRLSCERIEGAAFIDRDGIIACCYRSGLLLSPYNGGPIPARDILASRNRLRRALDAGEPCICGGCSFLRHQDWPDDDQKQLFTGSVHISHYHVCNIACTYCSQADSQNAPGRAYNFLPVAGDMLAREYLSPDSVIHFGSGEPTGMPEFADLLRLFAGRTRNSIKVVSNGTIFSPELEALLKAGRAQLEVSLDCASRETYKKIKGRDLFLKVLENLRRYACAGVTLKYIVLPENRGEDDGRAFLDLAEKLGITTVKITTDYIRLPLSPTEMDRLAAMLCLARKRGFESLDIIHEEVEFHSYLDYRQEVAGRVKLHGGAQPAEDGYRVPGWNELVPQNGVFARELHFLLTGRFPVAEEGAELEAALKEAPSRFHAVSSWHGKRYDPQGAWAASPLTWALLWRLYAVALGRLPRPRDLELWKGETLTLGLALDLTLHGDEFQNALRLAGDARLQRADVLALHALILGSYPDSEREILRMRGLPTLDILAASLRLSEKCGRLLRDIKPVRHMPLVGTRIAALDPERLQSCFPGWIGERIMDYADADLFTFWKNIISRREPPALHSPGKDAPDQEGGMGLQAVGSNRKGSSDEGRRISVLWFGAGDMTARLLPSMREDAFTILAFVDENMESGAMFMGRPVLTSLADIAAWNYDYILVAARPYGRIYEKLLRAGARPEKIVSLDIEEGAYELALRRGALETSLEACVAENPALAGAVRLEKLRDTLWFRQMEKRWNATGQQR